MALVSPFAAKSFKNIMLFYNPVAQVLENPSNMRQPSELLRLINKKRLWKRQIFERSSSNYSYFPIDYIHVGSGIVLRMMVRCTLVRQMES